MAEAKQALDLDRIIFIGRTYDEYASMFNLSHEEIQGIRVLDCPAGACSFTARANRMGSEATAADIAYAHEAEQLYAKGLVDLAYGARQVEKVQASYSWSYFKSVDQLAQSRRSALEENTADRKAHPSRYIAVVLPELPFQDRQFELTLSAHFLFSYSEQLDLAFHQATVLELMRVDGPGTPDLPFGRPEGTALGPSGGDPAVDPRPPVEL
ncbi:SAM-dependent methyltransferase [Paenibacillus sp. 1P07SE]|uniref:SAM-dependent methyltransferase n=1 Tax=Paenibacillus sp. 1P07SE TaxID=3132209 RepID=UPI0039A6F550